MNIARNLLSLSALTLLATAPVSARDREAGSGPKPARQTSLTAAQQDAVRAGHAYANCLVHQREADSRRFIEATTVVEMEQIGKVAFGEAGCPNLSVAFDSAGGQSLAAPVDIQRGMIAEALLAQGKTVLLQPLPLAHQYHSKWAIVSGRSPAVEEMAVCMASSNPAAIQALLTTKAESPAENVALQALVPVLGPCLVTNARLTANHQSLRAALAEALYHRVAAAADPSCPAAK